MSEFYPELAAVAQEVLAEFGAPLPLKTVTPGAYNPATGTASSTTATTTITAAVFDHDTKFIDGTLILAGDKQAYASAAGLAEPKPGAFVTVHDVEMKVIAVKTLAPAGISVLYELQLRKA